jgi:uncharacterized OB-fold protein
MAAPTPIPDLADGTSPVVATPNGTALLGSLCRDCGASAFPARPTCHRCGGAEVAPAAIGVTGTVYASTTVHVSSSRETPYHLAYVDLDGGPRVLGRTDTMAAIGEVVRVTGAGRDWRFAR